MDEQAFQQQKRLGAQKEKKRLLAEDKQKQALASIDNGTWMLMGGVGLFFDTTGALVNLIPVAGQIMDVGNDLFADATFLLWFTMKGMRYSKSTAFGTFILKFVPILNILPEYTLMIVLLYLQSKKKTLETPNITGALEK